MYPYRHHTGRIAELEEWCATCGHKYSWVEDEDELDTQECCESRHETLVFATIPQLILTVVKWMRTCVRDEHDSRQRCVA